MNESQPHNSDSSMWAKSFKEFWPIYIAQHSNPKTRLWHYTGTLAGLLFGAATFGFYYSHSSIWESLLMGLFVVILVSYGILFVSHWVVEGNQPATLQAFGKSKGQAVKEVLWSIRGDYRMLCLALQEKTHEEFAKFNIPQ